MDNITILTPEGATLMVAQIGVNSIYHNELEGDEYVSLEWEDYEFQRLEVGCYVVYENKVYRLTEPHEPSRRAEDVFVYTPVFYPSQYHWRKAQACFYTYDGDITINKTETSVSVNVNKAITSRELDWSFTGDFKDALSMLLQAIKNETNEVWVAMFPAEIGAKLVKIDAQGLSIFDMLGQIVEQTGKEFWFENSGNTHNIHIGTLEISTSGDHTDGEGRVVLNVGEDITNPNVTSEPKEYFTRFYFFGSNRNIEQPNSITKSSVVNRRLPLNPAKQAAPYADMKAYPQGFIDIDVNPATSYPNGIYTPTLPAYKIFSQSVFFDDIYPHCNYKVKAVEQTEIPVKDEAGKETGERMPIYFVSLYDAADQTKSPIPFNDWVGEVGNVMGSMLPALVPAIAFRSGYLQGLEFDVHYRKAGTKPYSTMANPLQYNCFEVIFDTNSNPRIPNGTIKPLAEDACTLLNIKMPESYIRTAQQELEAKALEYIAEQGKDKSTYDANSDPKMFENCPALLGLEIGAKAKLVYPNGSGVVISRVVAIERHLDIPSDCKVTLGYRSRQGSIQTLRALVEDTSSKTETVMAANNLSQRRINEMHNGFVAQKEAFDSYFDTETGEFDGSHIKPSTVQAGALSVGARNQQFSLSGIGFSCDVVRSNVNNTVTWTAGSLSHYTIQDSGVKTWTITSGTAALTANSLYYIYAKVSRTGSTGTISITTTQYRFDQVANYYYFLIGTVSSRLVSSGTGETTLYCRLFSTSYGTTSINGREITTGAIKSADGSTIFDLDKAEIIGNIRFKSGTQGMTELNNIIGENETVVAAGEAAEDAQEAAANALLEAQAAQTAVNNIEIGGRNLFKNTESRHFSLFSSPTVTFTDNVEVTEWNTSKGIRAAGTKGTNNVYGTYQSPTNQHWGAKQYVVSIYIKNLGQTKVAITQNGNMSNRCVWEVGEEGRKFFVVDNHSTSYNMGFNFIDPDNVSGYAFDFVYWHPKVEEGNVPTDWTPAPEDTEAAIANLETELKEQIDGKVETWSQSTDPSTAWDTTEKKEQHKGDLWYYTGVSDNSHTNNKTYKYTKSGDTYSWVEYSAGGGDLFDKIDGKSTIYYGAKSGSYPNKRVGDFLFDNTTGNEGKSYRWSGTAWVTVQDYQTAIQSGLNSLQIGGRNLLAVSKAKIGSIAGLTATKLTDGWFHIEGTITGTSAGLPRPLWGEYTEANTIAKDGIYTLSIETRGTMPISDKYKVQIYSYASGGTSNGSSQYITTPNGKLTIDLTGRWLLRVVMYKTADATGTEVNGDIRFKLEKGNKATDWTPAPEDTEAELTAMQTVLQAQIDGKIETWSQVADPSADWTTTELKDQHVDDLWYYTGETTNTRTNNKTYKYTKSGSTYSWAEHSAGGGDLFNKIKGKSTIFYNSTESGYTPSGVQDGDFLVISSGANQGKSFRWLNNAWVGVQDYQTAIQNGINSIQIGGRNLLRGTQNLTFVSSGGNWNNAKFYKSGTGTIENVQILLSPIPAITNGIKLTITAANTQIGFAQSGVPLNKKTLTQSVWVKGTANDKILLQPLYSSTSGAEESGGKEFTIPDSDWHLYEWSKTPNYAHQSGIAAGYVYLKSATVGNSCLVCGLKLEYGNKSTDWSPAQEDNEDFVRQQRAEIENGTQYLKDALRGARTGETIMEGGLVLSTMIGVMNQSGNVQAALNGAAANSEPIIMGGMARVSGMPLGTFRVYPDGHLEIHETEAEMIYIDKGEIQFKASTGIRNRITTATMGASGIATAESTITGGTSTSGTATLIAATTGSAKVITLKEEGTWSEYVPYQNGANTVQKVVNYNKASAMLINSGNLTLSKTGTLVFNAFSIIIENITETAVSVPSGYNSNTDDGIKLMYKEQVAYFTSADIRTWVAIGLYANGSLAYTFYSESMGLVTDTKTISIPQVTITGLPPANYTLAIAVEVNGGNWTTQFEKDPTWQTHFAVETNHFSAKTAYRARISSAVTCSYSYEAYQNVMFRDGLFMSKKNTDWLGIDPESRSTGYGMLAAKSSKTNAPLVNLSIGQGATSATTRFTKSGWLQKIGTLNATSFCYVNMITLVMDVELTNSSIDKWIKYDPYGIFVDVTRITTGCFTLTHNIGHRDYMVFGAGFVDDTSLSKVPSYVTFYDRKVDSVKIRIGDDASANDTEAYIVILDFRNNLTY